MHSRNTYFLVGAVCGMGTVLVVALLAEAGLRPGTIGLALGVGGVAGNLAVKWAENRSKTPTIEDADRAITLFPRQKK
ncbi:MAG: hypothetical protein KIT09_07865 [Bryobacteraceae bacterium]|nr:hypothetical protein [Bryobacteraceae bacterium]